MKTLRLAKVLALASLLAAAAGACGQDSLPARVDAFVNAEMRRQRIPGMSVAVVDRGKTVVLKGYGLANVEHRVPVRPETVFQSGSVAKSFTATAVMLLVQDGRLSLDDKVSAFFPDAPASWKEMRVRHLLAHTAGLGDWPAELDLRRDYREDEFVSLIAGMPLASRPGEAWDYSNLGYVLAGALIRKVTGKFYGDVLQERVFRPLGMERSRVISESEIVPDRAAGYRLVDGELRNQEWVSPSVNTTADGSLYLTAADMVKWANALSGETPLSGASRARMWTPVTLSSGAEKNYGFGWHLDVVHGHRAVFHGGAWQGFKAFIARLPDEAFTVMLFANLWQANDYRLARGLTAIFRPEFALPAATPIEDREPEVTRLLKDVLRKLGKQTVDLRLFTEEARAALFPKGAEEIAAALNRLSLPVAVIGSMDLVGREERSGVRVYRYLLTDFGRSLAVTLELTSGGRIAGLRVSE